MTAKNMIKQWCKKGHADKVLNRAPYRDTKTGKLVWRNPALGLAMKDAAHG